MTDRSRQNPYTQRAIERAIKAAMAAGLRVIGVRADGTVLTELRDNALGRAVPPLTADPRLRNFSGEAGCLIG